MSSEKGTMRIQTSILLAVCVVACGNRDSEVVAPRATDLQVDSVGSGESAQSSAGTTPDTGWTVDSGSTSTSYSEPYSYSDPSCTLICPPDHYCQWCLSAGGGTGLSGGSGFGGTGGSSTSSATATGGSGSPSTSSATATGGSGGGGGVFMTCTPVGWSC